MLFLARLLGSAHYSSVRVGHARPASRVGRACRSTPLRAHLKDQCALCTQMLSPEGATGISIITATRTRAAGGGRVVCNRSVSLQEHLVHGVYIAPQLAVDPFQLVHAMNCLQSQMLICYLEAFQHFVSLWLHNKEHLSEQRRVVSKRLLENRHARRLWGRWCKQGK